MVMFPRQLFLDEYLGGRSFPRSLKPFFCYFGGKWRIAPKYTRPRKRIVEPFAGSAGYSTRYASHDVVLVEKDPRVARVWMFLIDPRTTEEVIYSLPLWDYDKYETVDDAAFRALLPDYVLSDGSSANDASADFIGFWLNQGAAYPHRRPTSWMKSGGRPMSFWGPERRNRIATQISAIKHWTIINGDWSVVLEPGFSNPADTTYFVDPPYTSTNDNPNGIAAGSHYRYKKVDYEQLGASCIRLARAGAHVIACEGEGATWLPFVYFCTAQGSSGAHKHSNESHEFWWCSDMLTKNHGRS